MALRQLARDCHDLLSLALVLRDPHLVRTAWRHRLAPGSVGRARRQGQVVHRSSGLSIDLDEVGLLWPILDWAWPDLQSIDVQISQSSRRFDMRHRDLIFGFESFDGFYIAHEVLFDRTYDIRFPKPTVVLDIGANFGLASLFFARLPQVEHVYSWEPIRETYLSLRANISRNASLAHKITPFQCGLSSSARRENWLYNPRFAGMTGAETPVPGSSVGELWRRFPAQSVSVDLEQASQAIARCCAAHPTADVFCKVDCEGGEYEIIGDLAAAGTLERIQGCVVEVHGGRGGNVETLKRSLSDFGFLLLGDCDRPVQSGRAAVLWGIRRAK